MITLEIKGKEYTAPQNWKEITLDKFIELCKIEIPEKLRDLWVASAGDSDEEYKKADDQIGIDEIEKIFPEYYGKVMECMTTVPVEIIDLLHAPIREQFFNKYLRHFIYSVFASLPVDIINGQLEIYRPPEIEAFEMEGVTYQLPKSLHVYGDTVPMGKEKVISFAEASDIEIALRNMAEGAADRLPMFIAIYCRPEGEEYNEDKVLEREKLFRELSMETVWTVFFYMYERLTKLLKSTRHYSANLEQRIRLRFANLG